MTTTGEEHAGTGTRAGPAGPWWWAQRRGAVLDVGLALVSALGFDRPEQLVGRVLAQFIEDDMEEVPGPPPDPSGIKEL